MSSIKLKLHEYYSLDSEINGLKNPQTNEVIYKGFINHNLSVVLKYDSSTNFGIIEVSLFIILGIPGPYGYFGYYYY